MKSKILIKTKLKNVKKSKKKINFLKRNKKYSKKNYKTIKGGHKDNEYIIQCKFKDETIKDIVRCNIEVKPKVSSTASSTASAPSTVPSTASSKSVNATASASVNPSTAAAASSSASSSSTTATASPALTELTELTNQAIANAINAIQGPKEHRNTFFNKAKGELLKNKTKSTKSSESLLNSIQSLYRKMDNVDLKTQLENKKRAQDEVEIAIQNIKEKLKSLPETSKAKIAAEEINKLIKKIHSQTSSGTVLKTASPKKSAAVASNEANPTASVNLTASVNPTVVSTPKVANITVAAAQNNNNKTPFPTINDTDYPSLKDLFNKLKEKKKTGINNIFVFDFDNTLVKHSAGVPIGADIKDDGKLVRVTKNSFGFIKNDPEKIIDENQLTDDDYNLTVEPEQYDLLKKMFTAIRENANNIIIILSRGVEKLIKLFFKNKLHDLETFFILGANNIDDISRKEAEGVQRETRDQSDDRWANKKARAIKYIYDFTNNKMKGNIMFYDDTPKNITNVDDMVTQMGLNTEYIKPIRIKSFFVSGYKQINVVFLKSII